jgi:hypothetical protein
VDSPDLPSYSMPNALIRELLASAIVRFDPAGWNMPSNRTGSPVSTPNGTMSSTSKSIASPIRHRVTHAVVGHLDGRALDAKHLADERRERPHRATELPAEDADELLDLLVRRLLVHEHAELPIPFGHDLRRIRHQGHLGAADVGALDVALTDVEDERDSAEVVRGAVVE